MADLRRVDPGAVSGMVARLREGFNAGTTRPKEYRLGQLKNLLRMLEEKESQLTAAVFNDLRRSERATMLMEVIPIKSEIINAINNLDNWMKPEYVKKDLINMINSIYVQPEPFGVVCVFSAWNYPLLVLLQPMAAAIAAGNAVLLKPSELAVHTSNVLMELIPQYMDPECYAIVAGGIPLAQAVLKERFDHIMYTGGSVVGKIIMKAAAEHLTPVTLELGGKCPCYVDSTANLRVAARRIAWGKYANAGQTCLAPDYILCHQSVRDDLVTNITAAVKEYYGEDPKNSKSFARIISERHFDRVKQLLQGGGEIKLGGDTNRDDLYIAPTIMVNVTNDHAVMQDEIFGPLLPIVVVDDLDGAIQFINAREKPLALYAFTTNKQAQKRLSASTSSGGFVVNDVMIHFSVLTLPFGGVGNSGFGAYHGKFGFDTFSHKKACYITNSITEPLMGIRYPPFTERKIKIAKTLIVPKVKRRSYFSHAIILCFTAVLVALALRALGYSFF